MEDDPAGHGEWARVHAAWTVGYTVAGKLLPSLGFLVIYARAYYSAAAHAVSERVESTVVEGLRDLPETPGAWRAWSEIMRTVRDDLLSAVIEHRDLPRPPGPCRADHDALRSVVERLISGMDVVATGADERDLTRVQGGLAQVAAAAEEGMAVKERLRRSAQPCGTEGAEPMETTA